MAQNMVPPPPPPLPTQRGNMNGPPPPPPGAMRPGPPPGPGPQQPFQIPMRNSTRFVDLTPRIPLGEDACKKKLTTYEAHTIRKIPPLDSKAKPTWARSEITKESLAPEEISKEVKRLNEGKRSVTDKKQDLAPNQQKQITHLLDELNTSERDQNFEWSLAQIDQKIKSIKGGLRETTTITCYVKRAPLKDVNPVGLYNALERQRAERFAQMNRPPPQPQPPSQRSQSPGGGKGGGKGGDNTIINLGQKGGKKDQNGRGRQSRSPKPKKRFDRRHPDDHSSVSSGFSDTESCSSYTSSGITSNSTVSDRRNQRYDNRGSRRRSRSRVRQHHKGYYDDGVIDTGPEPRHRDSFHGGPIPTYVPDVPRGMASIPAFDPVAAAYQAGKTDRDAERYGLDQIPRIRPIVADRAIVTYGRQEPRYPPEPRYPSEPRYLLEPRYPEPRYETRYVDDYDDHRYRHAEEYIDDRRAAEPVRVEYASRRLGEPRLYANPNPFNPRRYAPSHTSYDSWP